MRNNTNSALRTLTFIALLALWSSCGSEKTSTEAATDDIVTEEVALTEETGHEGHDHSEHEHEHDNEADENESHEHSENCNHDHENELTTHPGTMKGIVKKEISLVDKYFWAIINHNIPITIVLSTLFISFGYSFRKSLSLICIFAFHSIYDK